VSPTGGTSPDASPTGGTSPDASPTGGTSPGTSPGTALTCPDTARDQTVVMWSPLTGGDGDEMTAIAAEFSETNEWGITVVHEPQSAYLDVLRAGALDPSGASLPTMSVVRITNVAELVEANALQPFTDELLGLFGADPAGLFPENVWGLGEYKGERYAVPVDMHPLVMYYNRDLFTQAGVEEPGTEPWTQEQFDAALAALEAAGVTPLALGTHFQAGALFQTLIRQYGGALTNEDGTEVTYNSEAGVQAAQRILQLRDDYSDVISGTGDPEAQAYIAGDAAILFHGPWWISGMQEQTTFTGFAPVPQMGGDQYAVWGGSHQFALTTTDPALQAAAGCWMAWFSENSVRWGAAGQVPARTSARENPELATIAPAISAIAASGPGVVFPPQVPGIEGALWGQGFEVALNRMLIEGVPDIQAALDESAATSQQIIDENAELIGD
jgi:multiple sugar transport system substrate-binding protein